MVQNIGNRLVQAVSRQAGKAGYFCAAENISANQAIHELRRLFKRLKALLRFFNKTPDLTAVQLQKDIRNFGKLLAQLRESAVNVELFDNEISGNKILSEKKIRNARELLVKQNKMLIAVGFMENNLCNTIRTFFDGFEPVLVQNTKEFPSKNHVFSEICKSYLKSYTLFHQLPANPHPEEWHNLRKLLKRLWYQLDFIRFLHPRYIKLKTDQLNKVTDQLGDDHDLHIFLKDLLAGDYGFNAEELRIITNQVENLRELNQLKLYPRLKQFFTAPPEEFDQKLERFFKL
jgi:CHAD domain-containing protein